MADVQQREDRPTIAPMVGRASAWSFGVSLVLLALYLLGSVQSFVDATMRWLLRMLELSLAPTIALALCSCGLYVLHAVSGRWRMAAAPAVLSLLAAALALVLLASLRLVSAVIGGLPPLGLSF